MFLFLNFPLVDQIETCVVIYKLVSLRFRYSTCLLLSNGQFYIPKTIKIWIKNFKVLKLWTPHVPFLVHLSVHSPTTPFWWKVSMIVSCCTISCCWQNSMNSLDMYSPPQYKCNVLILKSFKFSTIDLNILNTTKVSLLTFMKYIQVPL